MNVAVLGKHGGQFMQGRGRRGSSSSAESLSFEKRTTLECGNVSLKYVGSQDNRVYDVPPKHRCANIMDLE